MTCCSLEKGIEVELNKQDKATTRMSSQQVVKIHITRNGV